MDEYADCARGCMSKRQPLFKALVVAALVGGFFVGGYSAVGGGGRAARAAPAAGPPGRSRAAWAALEPPPPPEGRVILQSSGDLPGSSAWRRFVQRQGSPGSRGGRRRARSALKCWDGRPQAARPSILFGRPGAKGPGPPNAAAPLYGPVMPQGMGKGPWPVNWRS